MPSAERSEWEYWEREERARFEPGPTAGAEGRRDQVEDGQDPLAVPGPRQEDILSCGADEGNQESHRTGFRCVGDRAQGEANRICRMEGGAVSRRGGKAGSRQASQEGRPATSITGGDSRARRNVVISEPSRLPGPLRATSLEPRRRLAGQKPSSPRDSDLMALRSRTPPRARPCHCFRHRRVRPPSSGNTLRRSFRRQRSPRWGQPGPKSSRQTSHCRSSPASGPGSWRSRFDHSGHPNQG